VAEHRVLGQPGLHARVLVRLGDTQGEAEGGHGVGWQPELGSHLTWLVADGAHAHAAETRRLSRDDGVLGSECHPRLYSADVQLFWGVPLDGVRERIERLTALSAELGREHAPLGFGLRVTTLVRDTAEEAWADAEGQLLPLR
jgi:hypothetical protein